MSENGIILKTSINTFEETYEKLRSTIENNPNLTIVLELDHQANAASVNQSLPPTKIIMFGNPNLGTSLMAHSDNTAGLDLPQKVLVTERGGEVLVSYNDPVYLQNRHQISGQEEILQKISTALDLITTVATS